MRLTATSHRTLDGVVPSNGKPEPELHDGLRAGRLASAVPFYFGHFTRSRAAAG
jgi:hypothetical protein